MCARARARVCVWQVLLTRAVEDGCYPLSVGDVCVCVYVCVCVRQVLLTRAVEDGCCPLSVDLWLALARLEEVPLSVYIYFKLF